MGNKPIYKTRKGRFSLSLWEADDKKRSNTKIEYGWKGNDGKWIRSGIYCYPDELLKLQEAITTFVEANKIVPRKKKE